MNPSAVVEAPEPEKVSAPVQWKNIVHDVDARLEFIKRLRERPETKDMMPVASDTILRVARGETISQEEVDDLHDKLLVRGIKLETDTVQEVIPDQGYSGRRLTPQFPASVVGEENASVASTDRFLDDMKQQLSQTHREISQTVEIPQEAPTPVSPALSVAVDRYREPIEPITNESIRQKPEIAPIVAVEIPAEIIPEQMHAPEEPPQMEEEPAAGLMAPEVTEGLQQLLAEWKNVFDKSGIFGFGPHGIDHPLYKRLAERPMGVLAEGPDDIDPKILDSITEYIEGWQKEYGISPDPEESFETYLRRVIAEILDRETKRDIEQPIAA